MENQCSVGRKEIWWAKRVSREPVKHYWFCVNWKKIRRWIRNQREIISKHNWDEIFDGMKIKQRPYTLCIAQIYTHTYNYIHHIQFKVKDNAAGELSLNMCDVNIVHGTSTNWSWQCFEQKSLCCYFVNNLSMLTLLMVFQKEINQYLSQF